MKGEFLCRRTTCILVGSFLVGLFYGFITVVKDNILCLEISWRCGEDVLKNAI